MSLNQDSSYTLENRTPVVKQYLLIPWRDNYTFNLHNGHVTKFQAS